MDVLRRIQVLAACPKYKHHRDPRRSLLCLPFPESRLLDTFRSGRSSHELVLSYSFHLRRRHSALPGPGGSSSEAINLQAAGRTQRQGKKRQRASVPNLERPVCNFLILSRLKVRPWAWWTQLFSVLRSCFLSNGLAVM